MFEFLLIDENFKQKFCQILFIDVIQKTFDRRLNANVDDHILNRDILFRLQRFMKNYNFYVQTFKSRDDRIKENFDSMIKIHLKQ